MAGAVLIGAAVGGRDARIQTAKVSPSITAAEIAEGKTLGATTRGPGVGQPVANAAPRPAQDTIASLESPGYPLSSVAARALQDVRVTVADTAQLQQLRAQILAPAPLTGISGAALNDLASLVRQAQMASVAAGRAAGAPIDPVQLAQAQTAVKTAQQQLLDAAKARDEALLESNGAGSQTSGPNPLAGPVTAAAASTSATTAAPANSVLVRDAQARLTTAQAKLRALLVAPPPDEIIEARNALSAALAQTPAAPGDDRLAEARAAVDSAQKAYEAVGQVVTNGTQAGVASRADGRPTPSTSTVRTGLPIPIADPVERPQDTASRQLHGLDIQQVADTQSNLDRARAALADLERQAGYAADPESQQSVIDARKGVAALTAAPDPAAVADAQAVVIATQGQLDSLLGKPARPSSGTVESSSAAVPLTGQPAGAVVVPASSSVASTGDPVAVAEHRLTGAQKVLHDLISPSSNAATQDLTTPPAVVGSSAGLPAGSTTTQVTPEIQSAESRITFGEGVSRNDLSAIEVELRARYVVASALTDARLHPSALAPSATAQALRSGALTSHAFAWPLLGAITQPFGVPELGVGAPHTGVDIGASIATPVLASASGVVSFAGGDPSTSYGYYAIVDHGGGVSTLYGHLALPPFLHPGQFLAQGGLVGISGSTGFSTGPHLHFEVRLNGVPVDPLKVLSTPGLH